MSAQPPNNRKPWLGAVGVSAIGIAVLFTGSHEGTRYTAYPDPISHGAPWTICNGHTRGVHPGDTATPAQCKAWLTQDMADARGAVARCIQIPLNVNQAAALYDTAFNNGPRSVCGSTLQTHANQGNLIAMCLQITQWDHAGGRQWPGLSTRKLDASELCLWPTNNSNLVYPSGT